MKKIILFSVAILCCLNIYGQVTLTPSKAEIVSGETISVTASGEVSTKSIRVLDDAPLESVSIAPGSNYASYVPYNLSGVTYYSTTSGTKFNVQINNTTTSTSITIKLAVRVKYFNASTGQIDATSQLLYYQVKVNPKPASFGNQAQSQVFYRNNCSVGYHAEPYPVNVAANTYFASTQAAANTLATNYISTNGQTLANQNGVCTQDIPDVSITMISENPYNRLCAGPELDPVVYSVTAPAGSTFLWTSNNSVIVGPDNQTTLTIQGIPGTTGFAKVFCKVTVPGYGIVSRSTSTLKVQQCL